MQCQNVEYRCKQTEVRGHEHHVCLLREVEEHGPVLGFLVHSLEGLDEPHIRPQLYSDNFGQPRPL